MKKYNVCVEGSTGAVGREMLKVLEQRKFPIAGIKLFASERSKGLRFPFKGEQLMVEPLTKGSFKGMDLALFSAGASRSEEFAPLAVKEGCVVVDNSSAFRLKPEIPLVVPEVNLHALKRHNGLIANPNCSTIQLVLVLKPIHDAVGVARVIVSTYQSVSGAGGKALKELESQSRAVLDGKPVKTEKFPHRIAFNVIPHIDIFFDDGYTKEEKKIMAETHKIMEDESIRVTATCARVPVFYAHSESVTLETKKKISVKEAQQILSKAKGVRLVDDPKNNRYPMPIEVAGKDDVFVGRIRVDQSCERGLALWIVGDNLRKGAALNAVQIAEAL